MPEAVITSDRIPPQNLEAEMSVLGAVLQDPQALLKATEILRPEHFYKEAHRKIFSVCEELFKRSEPVDLVTVTNELMRRKHRPPCAHRQGQGAPVRPDPEWNSGGVAGLRRHRRRG